MAPPVVVKTAVSAGSAVSGGWGGGEDWVGPRWPRHRNRRRLRAGADRRRRPNDRAAFFDSAARVGRARAAAPRPQAQRAVRTALQRGPARSLLAPTTQPTPQGTARAAAPAGAGAGATAAALMAAASVPTIPPAGWLRRRRGPVEKPGLPALVPPVAEGA